MAEERAKPAPPFVLLQGPTIAAGNSLSTGLDCSSGDLLRIIMPPDWDEAPLTFQLSANTEGAQWCDAFQLDGFEVTLPTVVPNSIVIVPTHVSKAVAWVRFRSGTRNDPVPQSAQRDFQIAIYTAYL